MMALIDRHLKKKAAPCPLHVTENLVRPKRCWRTKRKSFTWPSSETQGKSVGSGEKVGRTFSSTGERAPGYRLSPNYFQKFKRMPAPDWAQKLLCIIVPNRRTVSPEFFSWVVHDGYCLDHGLSGSCTKEMHAVRKLSVWYKIPIWFQNTVCPKTKYAF